MTGENLKQPTPKRSGSQNRRPERARGFTLVETLIAACVLTIILGLGVSLARHVRGQSARMLTNDVLSRLEKMLENYTARYGPEGIPAVSPAAGDLPEEGARQAALRNNSRFIEALRVFAADELQGLPASVYDPGGSVGGIRITGSVRDAWGSPIVLVKPTAENGKTAFGSSPKGGTAAFFVSPGPDRKYLELMDNLYSYDTFPKK